MVKNRPPSSRVKSKQVSPVKQHLACLLLPLALSSLTWAGDFTDPRQAEDEDIYKNLPEILARTFDSQVLRRSRSGRVFLFESERAPYLPVGRILLFKRNSKPVFAVRILRVYTEKNAFAAKGIRYYGRDHRISLSETFFTVEKIADIFPKAPSTQDLVDLRELEKANDLSASKTAATPPPPQGEVVDLNELEKSSAPPLDLTSEPAPAQVPELELEPVGATEPLSKEDANAFQLAEQDDALGLEMADIMIEEIPIFDPNRQWLTMGFAYLQNAGSYFAAGGMRYAVTLVQRPFYHRKHLQDSIALEGGAYVYKALNYAELSDSYLVVTSIFTGRYNLLFSPEFGMFFYAGALQNVAWATSAQSTAEIANELSGIGISMGLGFLFRVGPNWDARVDLGIDSAGLGLMLRF